MTHDKHKLDTQMAAFTNGPLFTMINHCAPTGVSQRKIMGAFVSIRANYTEEKDIMLAMLYILIDGVRYGNWPE